MRVSDRTSLIVMGCIGVATLGAVLLTSAAKRTAKEEQRPLFQENLEAFRGKRKGE